MCILPRARATCVYVQVRIAIYAESRKLLDQLGHFLYLRFGDDAIAQARAFPPSLGALSSHPPFEPSPPTLPWSCLLPPSL